jgi:hypothetical protein
MERISFLRLSLRIAFSFLFFLICLINVLNGNCATITVKQLGGGDFTTINDAVNNAFPDDTIIVYPGRYNESIVINKNLNLIGRGPQATSIISNSNGIFVNSNLSVKIIGFSITSTVSGIVLSPGSTSYISNNCIASNGQYGIQIGNTSVFTTIINNVIAFNVLGGIKHITNVTSTMRADFFNNIIYANNGCGIDYYNRPYSISNNNVFGNSGGNYCGGIIAGTGSISSDPLFINGTLGNFILLNTSPSRNAGRPGSGDADPDGSRNDMGAYGGPDAAPFWPYPVGAPIITELTITPQTVNKGQTITINARGEVW